MKIPASIIIPYKELHSWAGIICGLFLFTAFLAGAVTMFEAPLQRWLTPQTQLPAPPPLNDTPRLLQETFKAHPEAKKQFTVHLVTDASNPARLTWTVREKNAVRDQNRHGGKRFGAAFDNSGKLTVAELKPPHAAKFIDTLHQQAGLPLGHETALYIVGAICLLYVLALVSGLIVLLPGLAKDLFAVRLDKAFRRRWLDVHNVLGLFSLPFHIVIAVTTLVFAFHDVFYEAQNAVLHDGKLQSMWEKPKFASAVPGTPLLPPAALLAKLEQTAPGFAPTRLDYRAAQPGKLALNAWGRDDRYGLRAPTEGFAGVDPYRGTILSDDYLPGHQNGWLATVTAFFALHFGNYGGLAVRWSYVLLGLSGAFLFYSGNLLWLERRRRRNGGIETVATKILSRLTVGWALGTVSGLAALLITAKIAGPGFGETACSMLFYGIFASAIAWAAWRGEARAKTELAWCAGTLTALAPAALLLL